MTSAPIRRHRLSKSKIAAFEHCSKRLWMQIHRRNEGVFDAETLARFQFGHDVGARARFSVAGGVMVEAEPDLAAAIEYTAALLISPAPKPIFEATFQHEDVLVRVDILIPLENGSWQAIEVKAATRAKSTHLADLATQIWVMRGCGVHIEKATIRHLAGPVSWHAPNIGSIRFADTDVTDHIGRFVRDRASTADLAHSVANGPQPEKPIGLHCRRPFVCEFQAACRRDMEAMTRAGRQISSAAAMQQTAVGGHDGGHEDGG